MINICAEKRVHKNINNTHIDNNNKVINERQQQQQPH